MAPTLPLRSALFVPTASRRALAKSRELRADALLFDLEDSVLPKDKERAREDLRDQLAAMAAEAGGPRRIVRINCFSGVFGTEDFLMARGGGRSSSACILPRPSGSSLSPRRSKLPHEERAMKLYRFLSGPDDSSFCHKVSAALDKGWELHGSPTYSFDSGANVMRCGQAVVKELYGQTYDPSMKLAEH